VKIEIVPGGSYGEVRLGADYLDKDGAKVEPGMGGIVMKEGLCKDCLYTAHTWGMGSRVFKKSGKNMLLEFGQMHEGDTFHLRTPSLVSRATMKRIP
jgi:hypothetical protein